MIGPEQKPSDVFHSFIRTAWGLIQEIKIYPAQHPKLSQSLKHLHELGSYFLNAEPELTFAVIESEFIFKNKPLVELTESFSSFLQIFTKGNFSKLTFQRGVTEQDLFLFFQILSQESLWPSREVPWNIWLSEKHIQHISCGTLSEPAFRKEIQTFSGPEAVFDFGVDTLKKLDEAMVSGKQIDYGYLLHLVNLITPQVMAHRADLLLLGSLKSHHEYTFEHVMNVAVLSCTLGAALGLPEPVLEGICMGAVLHDIGKRVVPNAILDKPGKLTPEDISLMETHPSEGAKMILLEGNLGDLPMAVAMEHHLNFDGTGYPQLSRSRPLSLASRIVTITDFYDALRATRVYRGEMSPEAVYHLMQDLKGKKFDPELLDVFFETIGVYPPGIIVELDTGEKGRVLSANPENVFRPEIQIETEVSGHPVATPFRTSLTHKKEGNFIRTIVRSQPPMLAQPGEDNKVV